MGKQGARVLIIERVKGVFLVYGEWHTERGKCRGLLCKVRHVNGIFIRCEPQTGMPMSVHKSLKEAAWNGIKEDTHTMRL